MVDNISKKAYIISVGAVRSPALKKSRFADTAEIGKEKTMYRILANGFFGTEWIGITAETEKEAKALCEKYNNEADSPYINYTYSKEA